MSCSAVVLQRSPFPCLTLLPPQTPENAKAILARGVAALPDSVKLWMQAARLEQTDAAKKRVLLRCAAAPVQGGAGAT